MKRTYLKFANTRATLPVITSRRMQLKADSRHNIAYKTDADDDEDELTQRLEKLRSGLYKSITREQKEQLENLIEITEGKLEKSMAKKAAEITEKMAAADKSVMELKTANDAAIEKLKTATEEVASLKSMVEDQAVQIKANQPIIDAFVVNKDKGNNGPNLVKSLDDIIKETVLENTDAIMKFSRKETKSLILDIKVVGDMTTSNVTSGTRYGAQFAPNIIQQPYRKTHVRDLIPTDTAGPGNTFTHMRELTTGEGDITAVAETATKPQFDMDLAEVTVPFEVLAGWLRVTRKAMNNIPGFISWLQRRLPEKLMRVEDAQILYGSGVSNNLKGISHADNHTDETSAAANLAERIIDAISQLEDANERYATGVVVRPKEYYNFFKNKAGGSGEYDLPRNFTFVNGILYVSGIPVIPTTAVQDGDFFVGDWVEGAQLLIQEAMRLEFFEQDGTNVRENKVTVRIEETVALPVFGASYFIMGEVPAES
jgi:HK97 family phage major capsid protein